MQPGERSLAASLPRLQAVAAKARPAFLSSSPALQFILHLTEANMDTALRAAVSPLARALRDDPRLEVIYFHRHVKPGWNLQVLLRGRGAGFEQEARDRTESVLAPLADRGLLRSWQRMEPGRAAEEIAGEAASLEIEKLFHHDTTACLDLLDCETAGGTSRSRREFSLLMTERLLDLLRFDRARRLAFYHVGHQRPFEQGTWDAKDLAMLEERYSNLRDPLARLFGDGARKDAALLWGGEEPAAIADRCLAACRPHLENLLEAHAHGVLTVDIVPLAHLLCQRHCNRLGIDGLAEAVLRYFMFRLHQEERIEPP